MNKVVFEFVPPKTIDINGHEYTVLMDEDEIFDRLLYFSGAYEGNADVSKERGRLKELYDFCDQMIGVGALRELTAGHRMSIKNKACFVMAIAKTACEAYRDKVARYNE